MKKRDCLVDVLFENKDNCYFIHYSCQSLNDNNEALSPRVTAIVLLHFGTQQTITFSTHDIAEELNINRNDIKKNFNEIETILLTRFYQFIETKCKDVYWLHWNMKSSVYGFEHLEHRYRVLTGKEPFIIDINKRFNLSSMLTHKYGNSYADNPKMLNLMELNGERHRDFLTGEEEVTAFNANDYVRMLKSTICKVNFFCIVLNKMKENKLNTKKNNWRYKINQLYQHPFIQGLSIFGTFLGIAATITSIVLLIK